MKIRICIWECDVCDAISFSLKDAREHSTWNHAGWSKEKKKIVWAIKHQRKTK